MGCPVLVSPFFGETGRAICSLDNRVRDSNIFTHERAAVSNQGDRRGSSVAWSGLGKPTP
jgi:hypothetical protein